MGRTPTTIVDIKIVGILYYVLSYREAFVYNVNWALSKHTFLMLK